jgi:hypothetical protein
LTLAFVSSYKYLPGKIEKEEEKCAVIKQKTYKNLPLLDGRCQELYFHELSFLFKPTEMIGFLLGRLHEIERPQTSFQFQLLYSSSL